MQGMPTGEAPGILSIATTILLSLHNFHFCLRVSLRKTFLNLNISLGCYNATSSLMPLIALRTLKFFVECSLQEAQKYLVKSSPSRPSKQRFQIGRSLWAHHCNFHRGLWCSFQHHFKSKLFAFVNGSSAIISRSRNHRFRVCARS